MSAVVRFPIERRLPAEAAHLADCMAQIIARTGTGTGTGSGCGQVDLLRMARAFMEQDPEDRELLRIARERIATLPPRRPEK